MYKNIFIDLDNTIWAFDQNSKETFREMYEKYHFERFFDSFDQFFRIYCTKNEELWDRYGKGTITKEELNAIRYAHPFRVVGAYDQEFVETYKKDYMSRIAFKANLMPHTREALEYLHAKYNLYILSNGFRELQTQKLRSAKVDHYFKKIILSEDIGVHKPNIQIYHFALSATQSELRESIMIGDNWKTDIVGAQQTGMHCIYYNPLKDTSTHYTNADYEIADWLEIKNIL